MLHVCGIDRGRDRGHHRDEGRYSPTLDHAGRPSRHGQLVCSGFHKNFVTLKKFFCFVWLKKLNKTYAAD